jgi:hypothetical protein
MEKQIYFEGEEITPDDYPYISESYSVPFNVVTEVMTLFSEGKQVFLGAYSGVLRKRVEEIISLLSDKPDDVPAEPEDVEFEVVDNTEGQIIIYKDIVEAQAEIKNSEIAQMVQIVTNPIAEFFHINNSGMATLRADNPPTLEESYKVIDRIFVARETTDKINDYSTWLLGSITNELENYFGSQFDIGQVLETSEKAYNTVVTAVGVFKEYGHKKYALSFTHHKEAFYAKIEKEDKELLLQKAEEVGLSSKDVRSMASIVKRLGRSVVEGITSKDQIKDLINACKDATVDYLVYSKEDNIWTRIKSLTEPSGDIIINLKTNTLKEEDKEVKIQLTYGPSLGT